MRTGHTASPRSPSDLEALSAASRRFSNDPATSYRNGPRRTGRIAIAIASVGIGAAVSTAVPLQYICGATFRYAGKDHEASFNAVRDQLLLFCWNQTEEAKPVDRPSRDWFVDCPANGLARLCLESNSRISGLERVRTLANEYLAKHAAELSESRATPSESERLLSGFASDLEARLDSAQAELENSLPDLQTNDPITQRQELMNTWRERRERFATVRRDLGGAYAELDRLRTEPEPTHGVVPTESRHKALEADLALQQDLRELEVNLSELKHHLLNVWDRSTPPLNQLLTAARSLSEESPPDRNSDGPGGRSVSAMYDSAGLFYQALLAFAEKWEHERESLKGMAIDPTSGELIDLQQRARNDLNDFLYEAGEAPHGHAAGGAGHRGRLRRFGPAPRLPVPGSSGIPHRPIGPSPV